MSWALIRDMASRPLRGGECPKCRMEVILNLVGGLARLDCTNCEWKAIECARCDGTGFEGYDNTCDECCSSGYRPTEP